MPFPEFKGVKFVLGLTMLFEFHELKLDVELVERTRFFYFSFVLLD